MDLITRNSLQDFIEPNHLINSCVFGWNKFKEQQFDIKTIRNSRINFIEFFFVGGSNCNPILKIETEGFSNTIELKNLVNQKIKMDFNEYFREFKAFILFIPIDDVEKNFYKDFFRIRINYSISSTKVKNKVVVLRKNKIKT